MLPARCRLSTTFPMMSMVALLATALLLGSGCSTLSYLSQAGYGQREITLGARPLDEVVKDAEVPARTRVLLAEIPRIKAFGEAHGLSPTKNYAKYVDLHRPYVVWVLTACDPLAFRPKVWSFPIVGGVTYLGWFRRKDAEARGAELSAVGWDVDVRGSTAYSTLGWFDDPVLSTMIGEGDTAVVGLAETVLHESLHATLYVKNQSPFNESVATWVGDHLGEAYVTETRGEGAPELVAWKDAVKEGERRAALLHDGYQALDAVYTSRRSREDKLAEKARILADLERRLKRTRPLNNAMLVGFRTYHTGVAELDALHARCDGSYPRMIAALRKHAPAAFRRAQDEDVGAIYRAVAAAGCD